MVCVCECRACSCCVRVVYFALYETTALCNVALENGETRKCMVFRVSKTRVVRCRDVAREREREMNQELDWGLWERVVPREV